MANENMVPVNSISLNLNGPDGMPGYWQTEVVDYSPGEKIIVVECRDLQEEVDRLARRLSEAEARAEAAEAVVADSHSRPGFTCRCVYCERQAARDTLARADAVRKEEK